MFNKLLLSYILFEAWESLWLMGEAGLLTCKGKVLAFQMFTSKEFAFKSPKVVFFYKVMLESGKYDLVHELFTKMLKSGQATKSLTYKGSLFSSFILAFCY